mmetsp:Transcript_101306/g.295054  ORF Transcript_101306/g.295054 Transcript_101306/m.295054 type:complete len:264 (-) Transcript_101306:91-882(-)
MSVQSSPLDEGSYKAHVEQGMPVVFAASVPFPLSPPAEPLEAEPLEELPGALPLVPLGASPSLGAGASVGVELLGALPVLFPVALSVSFLEACTDEFPVELPSAESAVAGGVVPGAGLRAVALGAEWSPAGGPESASELAFGVELPVLVAVALDRGLLDELAVDLALDVTGIVAFHAPYPVGAEGASAKAVRSSESMLITLDSVTVSNELRSCSAAKAQSRSLHSSSAMKAIWAVSSSSVTSDGAIGMAMKQAPHSTAKEAVR